MELIYRKPKYSRRRIRLKKDSKDNAGSSPAYDVDTGIAYSPDYLTIQSDRSATANIIRPKPLIAGLGNSGPIQRKVPSHRRAFGQPSAAVALKTRPRILRQGLLSPAQAARAVQYNRYQYGSKSIMIIQNLINTTPNGRFSISDAQAVAGYQQNHTGLSVDGRVDVNALNVMVPDLAGQGAHSEAITLVTDFYNVPLHEVLSIHYDATVPVSTSSFESGYLRVIRVGPQAFLTATDLLHAIATEMGVPAPGHMAMHLPQRLNPAQVHAALTANRARIQDVRSILALQALVQVPVTGVIDALTCQHIAEFQYSHGLTQHPDGHIGSHRTLRVMVLELIGRGFYNSVIRLIIDYYNLSTHGALLDISAGPQTTVAGWIPGTTTLRIGLVWFRRSFAALVHQIANMLDRVRTRRAGIQNRAVRVFLGEAVEIVSVGTPEESLPNFMLDAGRALRYWHNMTPREQRRHWATFHRVRQKVHLRYTQATPVQQQAYQGLIGRYFSVGYP